MLESEDFRTGPSNSQRTASGDRQVTKEKHDSNSKNANVG